jgi:hypothetical protein
VAARQQQDSDLCGAVDGDTHEFEDHQGRGVCPGAASVVAGALLGEAQEADKGSPAKPRRRKGRKSSLTVRKGSHKRKSS